ncbi:type II CRISPR RNA-guided endonuclease Cas9 [Streptococcus cameli]
MTNGKILGLDIGIASVGVGVLEASTGKIIHASSRIFPAANADNNAERRGSRSSRRLVRRKKHRVTRVKDLFEKYGVETSFQNLNLNPYALRVKGLTEELSNEELFAALRNIVKRRGISYLDDASEDGVGSGTEYSKSIEANQELLKIKTPGEIQLERLENYGQVRGDFTIYDENGEKQRVINVFSTSDYVKEAKRILECQSKFHTQISDEFVNDYLSILTAKRKYYHGPGNEQSRTDYGRFRTDGTTLDNIFGILIGKCSFYPEEYRAAKASYTAQEFNFLNDLNNLTVPTETGKLSTEQKQTLVSIAQNSSRFSPDLLLKEIVKLVGGTKEDIRGYRLDAKDKPDMHTFESYRKMKNALSDQIEFEKITVQELDTLAHILTLNTEREGIEEAITHNLPNRFSVDDIKVFVEFRKKNSAIFSKGWHSLSVKLMSELIPELYGTSEEQMTILTRMGKQKYQEKTSKRTKYIDEMLVTDEIYNPVVAKSVRQAIKIINASVKKWGEFDKIVIEMPRDKNEEDERKNIAQRQKNNKAEKDAAELRAATLYNGKKELPNEVFHGHNQLATKIRLWYQQGERCLYTGQPIDIHNLIHNQHMFEIDHILPLSLSFDDSLANKVLVLATANQEKGQRTPIRYLETAKSSWSIREFKDYIWSLKGFNKKKREYLLTEEDINKIEVKQKFIARNLVDTSYASRTVLNALQDALKVMGKETKVSVVRGQFTSQLRRQWKIDKSRETYHHHAIDALVIAASTQLKLWKKQGDPLFVDYIENQKVDIETGEILSDAEYKEAVFTPPYQGFVNTIASKAFEDEILFSYQVDSKVNRKISDATIYGTRQARLEKDKKAETYVLGKIKDIYSQAGYDAFIKLYNKDKSKFLLYQKDPVTWEKVIEVILSDYRTFDDKGKETGNPFAAYFEEHGYICKYSRKNKGPAIKSLKYYDEILKPISGLNITPKLSKSKVILRSLNPWRTDVYFNSISKKYELMGIRYSDLGFEIGTGKYLLKKEKYLEIKEREGVSQDSEFKFTLYKNDLLLINDTARKQKQIFRFLSRSDLSKKNKVELKPYDRANFTGKENVIELLGKAPKRFIKTLTYSNLSLYKIKTDVLGNQFYIKKEGDEPRLDFGNHKKEK